MPIGFLLLGGGSGLFWKGVWKCQFYFMGARIFLSFATTVVNYYDHSSFSMAGSLGQVVMGVGILGSWMRAQNLDFPALLQIVHS